MTPEAFQKSQRPREVIAIIPARGGSKGLPRKNIVNLAGNPLIAYSILAARCSKWVTRIVVSTEDNEIAEIAKKWGAEVPFLRPCEMSGDDSMVSDAISYTIAKLGGYAGNKAFLVLFPTSPFRTPAFIDQMLEILFSGYRSVNTVKSVCFDPECLFIADSANENALLDIFGSKKTPFNQRRYYRPYASFYASMSQKIEQHYYHVLTDKCMLIDIDTPSDLRWAEAIIREKLFDFGF